MTHQVIFNHGKAIGSILDYQLYLLIRRHAQSRLPLVLLVSAIDSIIAIGPRATPPRLALIGAVLEELYPGMRW